MTPTAWLMVLLRTSLEGGALLLLIWAVTRLWPRMPAAARCGLWWLGCLRMLAGLVPLPRIAVPWTFTPAPPAPTATWPSALPTPVLEIGNAVAGIVSAPAAAAPAHAQAPLLPIAIAALWAAGVLIGVVLMARRVMAMGRAWRRAPAFQDARVARWRNEWAVVLGRGRVPEVRASADAHVPVAIGAIRPGLLLPVDSTRLSDDALRVVLAHEMSHVRRADPLLGWVPAAAQLLFWFHPLVRFAVREYLAAREEVCDADALRATAVSPRDYGALLVEYGVGRMSEVPGAACCGSRGSRDLKRRLEMLSRKLAVPFGHRMGAAAVTLAIVALAFAPIRFVAAHENGDDASSKERRAKEEVVRWKEVNKAYPDGADEMKKADIEMRKAELEAKKSGAFDKMRAEKRMRSGFAYAIKLRGEKGTRGSIDESDTESLRSIDRDDETAVYFRIGDEQWISHDREVIEEARRALEPEDRFDERYRSDVARGSYERDRAIIEKRRMDLQQRKEELNVRRDAIREAMQKREEAGRSTDDLRDELESIDRSQEELRRAYNDLAYSMEKTSEQLSKVRTFDKMRYAEMERVHQRVLVNMQEIAKRAIEDGRAERYEP